MKNRLAALTLLAATGAFAAGAVWTAFPPEFELESLLPVNGGDGSDGTVFLNTTAMSLENLGQCIASIGDTNGDGIDDILLGSRGVRDPTTGVETPQVFVVYGGSHIANIAEFDVSQLFASNGGDGSLGRVLYAVERFVGESCSGIGDLNNDGYADFILLGEPLAPYQYVVFGGPSSIVGAELDLATLEPANGGDGSRGFWLRAFINPFSTSLLVQDTTAGGRDFNNDGLADVMIMTNSDAYVIYGRSTGFEAMLDPLNLLPVNGGDGSMGVVIDLTESPFDGSVAMIGDFNGDTIDDIAVIDSGIFPSNAYVIFGAASGLPAVIDVAQLLPENGGDGSRGVVITGVRSVTIDDAGDFNADGFTDLIVGGPRGLDIGSSSIIFGGSTLSVVTELSSLLPDNGGDGTRGIVLTGFRPYEDDFMGSWSAGIGDLNGDHIADVAIAGQYTGAQFDAEFFVVFGRNSPMPATLSLLDLSAGAGGNGSEGVVLRTSEQMFVSAIRVASAGDPNNDGQSDLLVSNSHADLFRGRAYLILGRGDADRDGVSDFDDNCIEAANTDQLDTDNDGFGNICDPDLDNSLLVNFADLQVLRSAFFAIPSDPGWNEDADFNGDGAINFADGAIMRMHFFGPPGPSAMHAKP